MSNNAALLFMLFFSAGSIAGGLPSDTEVTPENADDYAVSVLSIDSGDSEALLYQVQFSGSIGSCVAGRVQTALYAGGREISSSSMDYPVYSKGPSFLVHFPAENYDLAVKIQYCCETGLSPGCKKSLSINSLKGWRSAANGS